MGKSPGGGHGNPPQDSFLENPMDSLAGSSIGLQSRTQVKQLSTRMHLLIALLVSTYQCSMSIPSPILEMP